MKLVQSALFVLAVGFAAPAMACDCGKNACGSDKDGKMACEQDGKKCDCKGEGKACNCHDKSKHSTKKKG